MKMLYVPQPILGVFREAGLDPLEYLDLNKVLNILSPEDVAFYLFTNLAPKVVSIPETIHTSMSNAILSGGPAAAQAFDGPIWQSIENTLARGEVERKLSDFCQAEDAPQLNLTGLKLSSEILFMRGGQVILFTHVPNVGDDKDCQVTRNRNFYYRFTTQLAQFMPVEELAAYPFFCSYLEATDKYISAA